MLSFFVFVKMRICVLSRRVKQAWHLFQDRKSMAEDGSWGINPDVGF